MPKIGRNEPCPCGSGRKYKKCHAGQPDGSGNSPTRKTLGGSDSSLRLLHEESARRYHAQCKEIHQKRVALLPHIQSNPLDALEQHEKWIRAEIAQILEQHSPVFWICLQRSERLTETAIKPGHRGHLSRVKHGLETMFWKYGEQSASDVKVSASGRISSDFTANDVCLYAGELAALALQYIDLPIVYRRVAKGATLELGTDGRFIANLPPSLNAAGRKYDQRRNSDSRYQLQEKGLTVPTTSIAGSWFAAFSFEPLGITACKWPLLFYSENTEPDGTIEYSTGGYGGFEDPRFMRKSLDLSAWEDRLDCFSEAMVAQSGMSIRDLKTCFRSLNDLLLLHLDGDGGVSCHELGLLPIPKTTLLEELTTAISKHVSASENQNAERLAKRLIGFLEMVRDALESFDLFSPPVPSVLNLLDGDIFLLDVTQIHRVLLETLENLQFDAKMRTSKGATFEAVVGAEIRHHCSDVTFPIPDSYHLFKVGDTAPFAEADLYIAKENLLFVVDCKAYCVDNRYLKGEPKVVRSRWKQVRSWLSKSDRRAKLISQNPVGANYRIPPACKYIIPVVCSSMAEYIWEDEPMTQLTAAIPRICTIQELIELIERAPELSLEQRPYAVQVAH